MRAKLSMGSTGGPSRGWRGRGDDGADVGSWEGTGAGPVDGWLLGLLHGLGRGAGPGLWRAVVGARRCCLNGSPLGSRKSWV